MKAAIPLAVVLVLNLVLSRWALPAMDTSYLGDARFGGVTPESVIGLWSLIAAIFAAVLLHLFMYRNQLKSWLRSVNEGTMGSLLPIFNTASEVGYGATIASLSSFIIIRDSVLSLAPEFPLILGGDLHQRAGGHHGLCIRRSEHCPRGSSRELPSACRAGGDLGRAATPGSLRWPAGDSTPSRTTARSLHC